MLTCTYRASPNHRLVKDCGQRQTTNHLVDRCPLTKSEDGLNLFHKADDDAVLWLESTATTALGEHTHTHPFNGPFSGTIQVSRHQKGRTNLDFTEETVSGSGISWAGQMQVCILLQTDNHTSTPLLSFYRPDALPAAQPTASKH